jgi:hypothetical protein
LQLDGQGSGQQQPSLQPQQTPQDSGDLLAPLTNTVVQAAQQQGQQQGPPDAHSRAEADHIERGASAWQGSSEHQHPPQHKGWRKVEVSHEHVRDRMLLS